MLPFLVLFGDGSDSSLTKINQNAKSGDTGTLEKMIVANGKVAIDLDLNRLNGSGSGSKSRPMAVGFDIRPDAFFKVVVFNGEVRGPLPSSMEIISKKVDGLPARLRSAQLIIESLPWGGQFDLVVRDGNTGFVFFNVEGHTFDYDPSQRLFGINSGRLLISDEFAAELGRPSDARVVVGEISVTATMRTIEISEVDNGELRSAVLPAGTGVDPENGTTPGPDVIVGDLNGLAQFGSGNGTQVGLAVGTDSCNAGVVDLNWFALPSNDHPVIPQNIYRMSGGAANDERFEQIGQSSVKHAFTALTEDICGFGCNGVGGTRLGSGCSDPYVASLNATPSLGSRAWINPFTGAYPRGDSPTPPNNHTGHVHGSAPLHRILTNTTDLNTTLNPGATYYAEAQYVTPHEYAWCQANPGQCNMYNNVSYRRYNVSGTTCAAGSSNCYSFSPAAATVRTKSAVVAWPNATLVDFDPAPGVDGIGTVAYKVTNPSAGVWHYEYAVYNQNLDRAIRSFSVPVGSGAVLSNIGFHAPPQHPGWSADGTVGNTGYSSAPWTVTQGGGSITWSAETFAQNPNANAIRWGTMYNFRFDSDQPPVEVDGTLGFLKTGDPRIVRTVSPSGVATPTPTATPTSTPTTTPTATPTATPTPSAGFEGDVAPRPNGDNVVDATDVTQLRRFATGLDAPQVGTNEGTRADCAPLATNGDGTINSSDVIQGRRFATGLDPLASSGGPTVSTSGLPESISSVIDDVYAYFFGRKMQVGSEKALGAGQVTIPVALTPSGNEAATSFTLEYDGGKLSNPRVVLGDGAPGGATLTVNATEAGRIGVLIDSAETMTASSIPQRIVMVTFDVAAGASGATVIAVTDSLAARGTADSAGNLISVRYVDGVINISPEVK
jgi:hypothetical protein